ncbi:MAG: glycosyltransferase family 39 protein [Gemmatimonadota bacterium]
MTDSRTQHLSFPRWGSTATVVALSVASSITNLRNTFVQDDLPIISTNVLVHSLRIWQLFTQAYWPSPYPRELYRPLTSSMFAFEWALGGGHPLAFRIVSVVLYLIATLAVYELAKRVLSPGAAWLAAAFFAVHPVHVEAVAVAVNQAELVVGALLAIMMTAYIDRRRSGRPLTAGWIVTMTIGYFVAALFKEHALLLPALMIAAELTVLRGLRPRGDGVAPSAEDARARGDGVAPYGAPLRTFYLALVLAAVSFIGIRNAALGGDIKGSFTAEALTDLSFGGRALTMLGVVPEWVRLFLWPAHLQADYSPGEIVAATHWGLAQTLGAALLVGAIWLAWACRVRRPTVTFGILWIGVGLALVSNMIIPTGIVLAERTLFLATIGVVIAGSDLLWDAGSAIYRRGSLGRIVAVCGLALLLGMGAFKSAMRQRVWYDLASLWYQTVIDAPLSYRARQAYGAVLYSAKMEGSAAKQYQMAIEIYPYAWPLLLDYADKLRERNHCDAAIKYYKMVLKLTPQQGGPRASEIACLVYTGKYAEAVSEARIGGGYGIQTGTFGLYKQIADSALRVNAPAGTVILPPPIDSLPTALKKP